MSNAAIKQDPRAALKKYFGFDSFRPLQEEIVGAVLDGQDVMALLPTGGGKSLCYQLPAVVNDGLTIVVSPLIALMKDQVDGLSEAGVPATFLNSTLDDKGSRERWRGLHGGKYRLLYLAPERLMLEGMLEVLKKLNVRLIAIDEAHCVSEWGHDFRPEYRQLRTLREAFPGVPVMALTATATERVRADIARSLGLNNPKIFVGSFNRPNIFYRVVPRSNAPSQLRQFLSEHKSESGIVYCQSRKRAEDVAEQLQSHGVNALPYHAGLTALQRARNQERFIKDDIQVICATIAFGMGIDKPNVRFVVHYDLPKNLEGYYQETGRAGRDGLPSECLLLFSSADVAMYLQFIDEKSDELEKRVARQQLMQMVAFAESSGCRRIEILRYFGETYKDEQGTPSSGCNSCDSCQTPREKIDGGLVAQKFLSCIYRIGEKSGFNVGLNHVVEVLAGARTEKIERWGHDKLSTYGIGSDISRGEWMQYGREIIRLGYAAQNAERFNTIEITEAGRELLKKRTAIMLTKPLVQVKLGKEKRRELQRKSGEMPYNEALFDQLRQLRKRLADERNVPAYVVFSDVTLREMAAKLPRSKSDLLEISGIGEKKLEQYGEVFLEEIKQAAALKGSSV